MRALLAAEIGTVVVLLWTNSFTRVSTTNIHTTALQSLFIVGLAMGDAERQQAGDTHEEPQRPGPGAGRTAPVALRAGEHPHLYVYMTYQSKYFFVFLVNS